MPAVASLPKGSNFAKSGRGKKDPPDADDIASIVTRLTTQRKADTSPAMSIQPAVQLQAKGVPVNDDPELEREADVMGAKALQTKPAQLNAEDEIDQ